MSHLRRGFWQPSPLLLVVPLVLTVAAYARVLGGGFVFDDPGSVHDAVVKDLAAQARLFLPALFHSGRPVVDLSLALNYAAGGLDARGYHAANITIHLATVFVVFAFTARTLELAGIARGRGLALAVAGVFALHPLQSEAVSYVSQRAESLASAFYLIALLLLLATERALSTAWRVFFWAGAYGTFLFGLGTKPMIEGGLAHDPANAEILASLSEAWWHRGDQSRAESLAERALATKPGLGGPLLVLGAARKAREDLEGAVSVLARATKAYPDWAIARLNLADVYAQLGRKAEACAAWRTVLHSATAVPEERARALSEASAAGCAER